MSDPMLIRAVLKGETVEVKALIAHVMETGQRKDADGNLVPAHYIETLTATCGGREVFRAEWGASIARNPYLAFRFKGARIGDKITLTWTDTAGESRSDAATIR